jgi:endonuclease/exonuclease/phosphatase (EEP) superfamily protein YafD
MAAGTLLSLSRHPHWFIRGWEFPRPLIAGLASVSALTYAVVFFDGRWIDWGFMGVVVLCVAWQSYRILPYTPLRPVTVKRADRPDNSATLRLVASNVQQENTQYDRWLQVVRRADPDIILAVEVDETWTRRLDSLQDDYPYVVRQPQNNYYGMVLLSRLKLIDPTIRFLVQEDVPSVHGAVELRNGRRVRFHGLHPRPPEPIRGEDATERDAEVVLLGHEINERDAEFPTVVAGDFNDVAWSHTTDLFLQLSGLLDPRKGRGLFNTFHAEHPYFRFPLDHVFHSNDFRLVDLRRLGYVGSDHFPVLIELDCESRPPRDQPEPEASEEDLEEAKQKVEQAVEKQNAEKQNNDST